jgi:hypothetical protein
MRLVLRRVRQRRSVLGDRNENTERVCVEGAKGGVSGTLMVWAI